MRRGRRHSFCRSAAWWRWRPTFARRPRSRQRARFSRNGLGPDRPLDDVGVDFDTAVVEEELQGRAMRSGIADSFGQFRLPRDARQFAFPEVEQRLHEGSRRRPSRRQPRLRQVTRIGVLDGPQLLSSVRPSPLRRSTRRWRGGRRTGGAGGPNIRPSVDRWNGERPRSCDIPHSRRIAEFRDSRPDVEPRSRPTGCPRTDRRPSAARRRRTADRRAYANVCISAIMYAR